jgi:DNA-binding NarL/FixJ family response regulator
LRSPTNSNGSALVATAPRQPRTRRERFSGTAGATRRDSARRAAARSRELFIDGQGGLQPVIEGLTGPAAELSPREGQLVDLAKQGLTNAQIAERLVLSSRTVESHLYRAMQKLGVRDRRKL